MYLYHFLPVFVYASNEPKVLFKSFIPDIFALNLMTSMQ